MKKYFLKSMAALLFILPAIHTVAGSAGEKKMTREINLNGRWKFSIMHSEGWAEKNFDDSDWDEIIAPDNWEGQGYNGYNGYGFYRKKVRIDSTLSENQLYLVLGYIDDVDEAYFNGKRIGSTGSFPPHYVTAWNANRTYTIPEGLVKPGVENIIAIKVFDMTGEGGITKGELGIYTEEFPLKPDINLVGEWKFDTRDDDDFMKPDYDDSKWDEIMVPDIWENQGYRNYDGCAWYRKHFTVDQGPNEKYMVLLAGKIDDVDQLYLNGEWIGETGVESEFHSRSAGSSEAYYNSERAYIFPAGLLKKGDNVIAVRVVDGQGSGGIYEGPVGIVSQSEFVEYWKKRSQKNRNQKNNNW